MSSAISVGSPLLLPVGLQVSVVAGGGGLGQRCEQRHLARVCGWPDVRSGSSGTSPASVQAAIGRIRFSVRVPVLSVQITSVEPRVSTALERLTSAPRRASSAHRDRQRQRDYRQQPLGHVAGQQADRENDAVREATGRLRRSRPGRRRRPSRSRSRRSATRPCGPGASSGLGSSLTRSESAAMRPSSVCIPVANTSALGLPAGGARAAEQEVPRRDPRDARVDQLRGAQHRRGLAGERRDVDLDATGDQAHVGGDAVALLDQHDVARDQLGGQDGRWLLRRAATVTCWGRNCARASTARSACISWTNANSGVEQRSPAAPRPRSFGCRRRTTGPRPATATAPAGGSADAQARPATSRRRGGAARWGRTGAAVARASLCWRGPRASCAGRAAAARRAPPRRPRPGLGGPAIGRISGRAHWFGPPVRARPPPAESSVASRPQLLHQQAGQQEVLAHVLASAAARAARAARGRPAA